jgi:hypothetical protein
MSEMHVMGVDRDTYDHGRVPGSVRVVMMALVDGEQEWTATHTVDGCDAGQSFSTRERHMVDEAMGFLGLVRHEPGPDDAPNVVETWHVDPDVPAPPFIPYAQPEV